MAEAVSAVLALRLYMRVCHAGVIDDFWGANFLNSQRSNDSWDNAGHGTGTSCTLGCPNDGSTGTGLGVALKASSCQPWMPAAAFYSPAHSMHTQVALLCCPAALISVCNLPAGEHAKSRSTRSL